MSTSTTLPEQSLPVYCTDEDILVVAGGDFAVLCPAWQSMAAGTDGAFAANAPWVLTSESVDFGTNGVSANQVVRLTSPKNQFPGTGDFLAIDSVSGNSITLRRAHKDLNVGQPPAPTSGLSGVTFAINTFDPQTEEASFDLKRRFAIDDAIGESYYRSSAWMYDMRDLRMATVYSVLFDRYTQETRTGGGDFEKKAARIKARLDDVLGRVQIRWGPFGNAAEPSTIFSCKVSR